MSRLNYGLREIQKESCNWNDRGKILQSQITDQPWHREEKILNRGRFRHTDDRKKVTSPEVIKLFPCSTQLSTKFQLLIKTKIPTNEEDSCFESLRCCIYHANKCQNANTCWHLNIYKQDKFRAQLS